MRPHHLIPLLTLALALTPACGDDKDDTSPEGDTDADTDSDTDTDTDVHDGLVGRIAVVEHYDQLHDEHTGQVQVWGPLDGPWEAGIVGDWNFGCADMLGDQGIFRVTVTEGECELAVLQSCSGGCPSDCPADTYCLGGEACVDAPVVGDAGTITLSGTSRTITLEKLTDVYGDTQQEPAELFEPGDTVTLEAPGADLPAFTATATGPAPLEATLPCETLPSPDEDFTITWTPSGEHGARVRWEMLQEVHLAMGPRLRCETEDDGSLTIPASLMQAYLQSERQTYVLSRYTRDQVEITAGHPLDFEVRSSVGCIINEEHTPW
ncbi:MAG: hypothetical protein ABIO70_06620 [Pseudomonadota bacterium]